MSILALRKLSFKIGTSFLIFTAVLIVGLITLITLMFSTKQVTKGYMVSALDDEYQTLLRDNEVKDMELSKVRALNFIESQPRVRRMVVPAAMVFVQGENFVAKR